MGTIRGPSVTEALYHIGSVILTSSVVFPRSSLEIFFNFISDQKMVPVRILEAVATTFSTAIGTRSRPCSFKSATKIECLFEMIKNAAL